MRMVIAERDDNWSEHVQKGVTGAWSIMQGKRMSEIAGWDKASDQTCIAMME